MQSIIYTIFHGISGVNRPLEYFSNVAHEHLIKVWFEKEQNVRGIRVFLGASTESSQSNL